MCARAGKIRDHAWTLPERVMLNPSDGHSSMHSHQHIASAEEGFGNRERFFVIYGFKCGLPGMLVSAEPRNLRAVAQNLHRMPCHNFCCTLAGGLWALSFSWPEVDFGGGGLVHAVLERSCGRWRAPRCTTTCFDVCLTRTLMSGQETPPIN